MKPSILTKINCLQLQQYEKVCLLDADVVFSRSMDAILEVQTPADLPQLLGALSEFIPFRLANWRCRPCDPIARAFEEKDGFLVSGSPILLPTGADIFVNLKTPSKTYRRNMKYDRMEFVTGLDEIMITTFYINEKKTGDTSVWIMLVYMEGRATRTASVPLYT